MKSLLILSVVIIGLIAFVIAHPYMNGVAYSHQRECKLIQPLLEQGGYLFKLLVNDWGVLLFLHTTEHCDATQPGIRYLEESKGNALVAMVKPGRVKFRHHRNFNDERVRLLWRRIVELPDMAFAAESTVTYQGREL